MIPTAERRGRSLEPFPGFEPLTANYLYCPNQFFDLCLPHHSRGVVRLVAFVLRKTLGWLDADGNPIEQNIAISYHDLIDQAGISRGAIREALDEAIAARFIMCVHKGYPDYEDQPAQTARFALCWEAGEEYTNTLAGFQGFYAGDGYRTPIPNTFFDCIVPVEALAVVKIVGTVLRHTVGYQNQFGGRRSQAPLSYSYIQRYANIGSRRSLAAALRHATQTGYIRCLQPGRFDPSGGDRSAATYSIRWLAEAASSSSGPKRIPAPPFKKDTSNRFRKDTSKRSKKDTGAGPERTPAYRSKKGTEKITPVNTTPKQQQGIAAVNESLHLLRDVGFDTRTAAELSQTFSTQEIRQQLDWLSYRHPRQNPLGMLRKAIEEHWPQPPATNARDDQLRLRQREQEKRATDDADTAAASASKKQRLDRQNNLLQLWRGLPVQERLHLINVAIDEASSDFVRARLRRSRDIDNPPVQALAVMASQLSLPE